MKPREGRHAVIAVKNAMGRLRPSSRGSALGTWNCSTSMTHKFALVPEVMPKDEWLKHRGQPKPRLLPPPDDDPEREPGE
jgi:hypothetical protein